MIKKSFNKIQRGFTLIELLIVIAILGVLASVVLVAIDPLEQLARGRDSGRKNAVGQLGNAVQSYFTSRSAVYPTANATWITTLQTGGEVKTPPALVAYSAAGTSACGTNMQNNYCYGTSGTEAVVFVRLESKSEDAKCPALQNAYFLWASGDSRAGVVCAAADPAAAYSGNTFVN